MTAPIISIRELHKSFGHIRAVRGVSLDVPKGQILGVLGPNGAGKTTTIRMITATLPPSRGSVSVAGFDTMNDSRHVRRHIGYLPESAPLYREMPVKAYLGYRAALFDLPRTRRRTAVDRVIERCWLSDVRTRPIGTLSKGYRQRVGLAAAMVHNPPILILDEPTSGLDPTQIAETRKLVRELAGEHTMLVISHILPEVEKSCDRIIIFAHGRIRADGSPGDLVRQLAGQASFLIECRASDATTNAESALRAAPGLAKLSSSGVRDGWSSFTLTFEFDASDPQSSLARYCADSKLQIRELRPLGASLEELYIRTVESDAQDRSAA